MVQPSPTSEEEVLARNDRIDREVVMAYRKLEGELKRIGIQSKPRYNLGPPLGRNPTAWDNRAK